jgi:large repetitive protein
MKSAAFKAAWVGRIACVVFVLVAVLAGCSGESAGSGTQEESKVASAASPEGKDDHATTAEGREVMIKMVANDSGQSLQIDGFRPGQANGDIICEAGIKSGRIQSCAYTPIKGFTGTDKFEYTVKDADGKTDTATVHVRVKPAS